MPSKYKQVRIACAATVYIGFEVFSHCWANRIRDQLGISGSSRSPDGPTGWKKRAVQAIAYRWRCNTINRDHVVTDQLVSMAQIDSIKCGTVKRFNATKGYGFIQPANGGKERREPSWRSSSYFDKLAEFPVLWAL